MCGFLGCGWMDMELDKRHLGFAVSMLRKDKICVDNLARACLLQMAPFQTYQLLRAKGLLGQAVVKNGQTHSKRTQKIKTQKAEKKHRKNLEIYGLRDVGVHAGRKACQGNSSQSAQRLPGGIHQNQRRYCHLSASHASAAGQSASSMGSPCCAYCNMVAQARVQLRFCITY